MVRKGITLKNDGPPGDVAPEGKFNHTAHFEIDHQLAGNTLP